MITMNGGNSDEDTDADVYIDPANDKCDDDDDVFIDLANQKDGNTACKKKRCPTLKCHLKVGPT